MTTLAYSAKTFMSVEPPAWETIRKKAFSIDTTKCMRRRTYSLPTERHLSHRAVTSLRLQSWPFQLVRPTISLTRIRRVICKWRKILNSPAACGSWVWERQRWGWELPERLELTSAKPLLYRP